jgi:hypothetical protein
VTSPTAPIAPPTEAEVRNPSYWQARFAAVAALAAVLLIAFVPRVEEAPPGPGPFHVGVFARRAGVVAPLPEGGEVAPGDELLFATWGEEERYVAVIVADTGGETTVAFPPEGRAPALHGAGRGVPLPDTSVTAGGEGEISIHAYFCPDALDLGPIRRALEAGERPRPAGCAVDRIELVVAAPEE